MRDIPAVISYPSGMATYTLTCIGDDRPGLVSELSAPISAHGGSWERSQMSRLAGKFAGILQLQVADEHAEALVADLKALDRTGLLITLERTTVPAERPTVRMNLDLLGADRPGIVAEITAAVAGRRISVEELRTDVREAPMAGGMLFEAQAVLVAPPAASMDGLRSMLEALADELMVEITLSEVQEVVPAG